MLISSCRLYADHMFNDVRTMSLAKHVSCELMAKYKIMVLACQIGPQFHLTLTQINSEIDCIAKNVIASNNLLCEIVSCSSCEYCISMFLIFQTVLNSFGISNKVLITRHV